MSPTTTTLTRREMIRSGIAATVGVWAVARLPAAALGLAEPTAGEEVIPFLNPQPDPGPRAQVKWDELTEWVTPSKSLFDVSHYGTAKVDAAKWKLEVNGVVDKPMTLSLDDVKARPKKELIATLECSGNGSGASFMGAIGNVKWTGTPLAPLLKECGMRDAAVEVAFYGADTGKETIQRARIQQEVEQHFARTLPIGEVGRDDILLCYEMNGQPLTAGHGAPLRLIVPGWYGVAWVKWLEQIEVRDRRLMTRFIAKDYVTLRASERDGKTVWTETSVGPMNVKSLVARVTRRKADGGGPGPLRITGVAWTQGRVKQVELKIDDGPWTPVQLDASHKEPHTWTFWSFEWDEAQPGEHTLVSRAIDEHGRIQPSAEDPEIKLKKTYYEAYGQLPRKIKI